MKKRMIVLMMLLSLILVPQAFAAHNQPSITNNQYDTMAPTAIIYVKYDATGSNDGSSWTDAYSKLQDALAAANSGDQIWVAAGVYYPDEGNGQTDNDRESTFGLKDGVEIYGGFDGTETQLTARSWEDHVTVLSGDIDHDNSGEDTNKDVNGVISSTDDIQGGNAYSVVIGRNISQTATLDGFIINAGKADTLEREFCHFTECGGGIYNNTANVMLENLIIKANSATDHGAGISSLYSQVILKNVTIEHNVSTFAAGGINNYMTNSTVTNSIIRENSATEHGGGVENWGESQLTLTNIIISANSAHEGGGIIDGSNIILKNVTIADNFASEEGGGIYVYSGNPKLTNVIVFNNKANGNTTSTSASIFNRESSASTINHSLIANSGGSCAWNSDLGINNWNNIDFDPKFVSNGNPNTTPPTEGNYNLQNSSPAINVGQNSANNESNDLAGNNRIQNSVIDMGAYESNVASTSMLQICGEPSTPPSGGNQPPQLNMPIPDITVTEGAPDQVINLLDYFSDPENDLLFFKILSNSNREVVPSALVGQRLSDLLSLQFGIPGQTYIVIHAEEDVHHKAYKGGFTVTVLPRREPTLSMSKSVSLQMVEAGKEITYTLTITNSGPGIATNARISDTLPAGISFMTDTIRANGISADKLGAVPPILAEGVTIMPNDVLTLTLSATVNADVMANQMITNTAQITSSEMLTPMLASEWIMTQPPSVMISDTMITEGQPVSRAKHVNNNNVMFAVTLSKASALPVTIKANASF